MSVVAGWREFEEPRKAKRKARDGRFGGMNGRRWRWRLTVFILSLFVGIERGPVQRGLFRGLGQFGRVGGWVVGGGGVEWRVVHMVFWLTGLLTYWLSGSLDGYLYS